MKNEKIAIIGAGKIGKAIEYLLKKSRYPVFLWDRDKSKIRGKFDFSEAVSGASVIFICVPSWSNREIAEKIGKIRTKEKRIVVTLSKGIEESSGKLMPDVLREVLRGRAGFGVLGGPMLADEIREGQPTGGVLALSSPAWKKRLQGIFSGTNLKLEFSSDLKGIAVCSVLKNIYSLALGMADGLGLKANAKSLLTVLACREMEEIVRELGGKTETFRGLAGFGDLLTTGWSRTSHNYKTGLDIIKSGGKCQRSEGCVSLPLVAKILRKNVKNYKILDVLFRIIVKNENAKKTFFEIFK